MVTFLCILSSASFLVLGCDTSQPSDCSATKLRPIPANPGETGPWPVGSETVTISGFSTEVWYPAVPGSQAGKSKDWIDTRQYLPDSTPDPNDTKFQVDSYTGLPLDQDYGPYPVIVFVHGTGSFRQASHKLFTHWASRGFVVLCADNPGISMGDLMEGGCNALLGADQQGDTRKILAAVRNQSGELDFLKGALATDRIGLAGHSAGGVAVGQLGDEKGVRVIIPMASGGVEAGSSVESAMIMGGLEDGAAVPAVVRAGYRSTPLKKRLVHIPEAGHNVFLSVCEIGQTSSVDLGALTDIANDGCGPEYMDPEESTKIVQFASTGAFEEVLACSDEMAGQLDTIPTKYPGVVYQYDPTGDGTSGTGCD